MYAFISGKYDADDKLIGLKILGSVNRITGYSFANGWRGCKV